MLNFKKAELEDIETLQDTLDKYTGKICDYSAGNIVFWRNYYKTSFSLNDSALVLRFDDMNGVRCYSYPISDDPYAIISELRELEGADLFLSCLTEEEYLDVKEKYQIKQTMYSEDWDDYLYEANDIVTLAGRRYSGQRNHINKFKKCYPDAKFERITEENAPIAKDFCRKYFHGIGKVTKVSAIEEAALDEQFDNWIAYNQLGGMLRLEDNVIGISVGEIVNDTLIVHTEKADPSFSGAYPMLTNSFAKEFVISEKCRFINREEDCGEEGLRISKRSYHPSEMIKKYTVII